MRKNESEKSTNSLKQGTQKLSKKPQKVSKSNKNDLSLRNFEEKLSNSEADNLDKGKKYNVKIDKINDSSKVKESESIDQKVVWKNALWKVAKILLILVVFIDVCFASLFVFVPEKCASVCEFFGARKMQEKCLLRVYEKSNEPYDLYKLIIVQDNHENYAGEFDSVQKMLSHIDFERFCDVLDSENIKFVSADKFGYVGNSRAYFLGKQVKCQIILNGNANMLVCNNLHSSNLTENTFSVAVRTILSFGNFDNNTKRQKIDELFSTWNDSLSQNNINELVLDRIQNLKQCISEFEQIGPNEIIFGYSLFEMADALYNAKLMQGNLRQIQDAKLVLNEARQIYLDMLS